MAAAGTMSAAALMDYHTNIHTSGLDMSDSVMVETLSEVKGNGRTNWMSVTYHPDNNEALGLLGAGEGGFLEMLQSFDDRLVVYGCFMAATEGQTKCAQLPQG